MPENAQIDWPGLIAYAKVIISTLCAVIGFVVPTLAIYIAMQQKAAMKERERHSVVEEGFSKAISENASAIDRMADTLGRMDDTIEKIHEHVLVALGRGGRIKP